MERPQASGTREALMERALAHLERPQGSLAVLVLFVGRRYYLRPILLWNARRATGTREALLEQSLWLYLERPQGYWNRAVGSTWNARSAIGTALQGCGPLRALLPVMVVHTYERSYEGEGLATRG